MPSQPISSDALVTSLTGAETVPIIQNNLNKRTTAATLTGLATRPTKLQIVGTKGGVPNAQRTGTTGGRSDVKIEGRVKVYNNNPTIGLAGLCVGLFGWTMIPNAATAPLASDVVGEASLELVTPNIVRPFSFNGTTTANIKAGTPLLVSAAHLYDLPPATAANIASGANTAWLRTGYTVASSASTLPVDNNSLATGDVGIISPNTTSQVNATGSLVQGTGIIINAPKALLLGIPSAPCPSVVIFGDSIATYQNDTTLTNGTGTPGNATGDIAYVARGVSASGIYYAKETVGSDRYAFSDLANGAEKLSLIQYGTDVIDEMGVNDFANGSSFASLKTQSIALWTKWKRISGPYGKPPRIHKCSITEITSSSNSYIDAAGQTISFGANNARQLYNAWLPTVVGQKIDASGNIDNVNGLVLLDGFIDLRPAFEDPANPGKWVTNGTVSYPTTDGIHPNQPLHILAAAIVTTYLNANVTTV